MNTRSSKNKKSDQEKEKTIKKKKESKTTPTPTIPKPETTTNEPPSTSTPLFNFEPQPETKFKESSSPTDKDFEEKPFLENPLFEQIFQMAAPNRFDTRLIDRNQVIPPTPGSAIRTPTLGDDFSVKGHHLKLIQDNLFDGQIKSDPHKHMQKFIDLCRMFKYGRENDDSVKLSLFPYSLTGEALNWYDELEENTIQTWDELRGAFITKFFPPSLVRKLLRDIRSFRQSEGEALGEAWGRFKDMLRNCHGHGMDKEQIVETFFYGLNHPTQRELHFSAGGNFQYNTPNQAYQMLEDQLQIELTRDENIREKRVRKTVASIDNTNTTAEIITELKSLTTMMTNKFSQVDNQIVQLKKEKNTITDGCNHYDDPHHSEESNEHLIHQGSTEDVSYLQNGYQRPFHRNGYQNQNSGNGNSFFNSGNYQNRNPRNNQTNQPNQSYQQRLFTEPQQQQTKRDEEPTLSDVLKTLIDFKSDQKGFNESCHHRLNIMRKDFETTQRNQQASLNDLEKKLNRISIPNRPTGTLPSNTQQNPRPVQEPEPSSSNQNQNQNQNQQPRYIPPSARNEHVNAITTRAGNIYDSNPADFSSQSKLVPEPVEDDFTDDEVDEEIEMEPKPKTVPVTEPPLVEKPQPKAYKPNVPYP